MRPDRASPSAPRARAPVACRRALGRPSPCRAPHRWSWPHPTQEAPLPGRRKRRPSRGASHVSARGVGDLLASVLVVAGPARAAVAARVALVVLARSAVALVVLGRAAARVAGGVALIVLVSLVRRTGRVALVVLIALVGAAARGVAVVALVLVALVGRVRRGRVAL